MRFRFDSVNLLIGSTLNTCQACFTNSRTNAGYKYRPYCKHPPICSPFRCKRFTIVTHIVTGI